jgi:rubrerythrin
MEGPEHERKEPAMREYSIREAVEMAVQTEKMGNDFYTAMAERFKEHEDIRDLFQKLALREQVHEKTFSDLKELIGDEEPEKWGEVADYLRAMVESAFFLGKDKAAARIENMQDYRAAVGFALAFEKETLLYFYAIRDLVKEKEIVDEIINEEQSHIMWLNRFKMK